MFRARELTTKIGRIPPFYISSYLVGKLLFDLYMLEQAVLSGAKSDIAKHRKKALRSGKQALKNANKNAVDRTEVFRLMGVYYWLAGRQNRALRWWNNSMKEGERLGFRVESARTHMEIGKRLLEKRSRVRELNGTKAEDYVKKARASFQEMGLQWDLEAIERIGAYGQSEV